jgi:hypothetical protein
MVYLHASVKLHNGKLREFVQLVNESLPLVRKHGWKLLGSYGTVIGRLSTVVDLWELPTEASLSAVMEDADVQRIRLKLDEVIEDEVFAILRKLPIG